MVISEMPCIKLSRILCFDEDSIIRAFELLTFSMIIFCLNAGTPSLAEPATIYTVLNSVNKLCRLDKTAEVSLEANPTSAETDKLRFVSNAAKLISNKNVLFYFISYVRAFGFF
mgnify:CR=1 FL=1